MAARIAISIGDYNGIGPEVLLKTMSEADHGQFTPVILANEQILAFYAEKCGIPITWHTAGSPGDIRNGQLNLLECFETGGRGVRPGTMDPEAGWCAMQAIDRGIALCLEGEADALVTAPISKEAVNRAGYAIPGHTEYLAEQTGTSRVLMMLVSGSLRVALATGHVPLKEVTSLLTVENLIGSLTLLHRSLSGDFGISSPRIAVLGVNPHAGDGGVIGREENEVIAPAIRAARESGVNASGPYPADGFFGKRGNEKCDAVLAIYHDQGLIPFKTLSFGRGVNFTAGLPIIRTSPDHGTAFDIAGGNRADHESFAAAYELARTLTSSKGMVHEQTQE